MSDQPTERGMQILRIMADHLQDQDTIDRYPPSPISIRDIRDRLELKSTSTVAHHINMLIQGGWCVRGPNGRAHLADKGLRALGAGRLVMVWDERTDTERLWDTPISIVLREMDDGNQS